MNKVARLSRDQNLTLERIKVGSSLNLEMPVTDLQRGKMGKSSKPPKMNITSSLANAPHFNKRRNIPGLKSENQIRGQPVCNVSLMP